MIVLLRKVAISVAMLAMVLAAFSTPVQAASPLTLPLVVPLFVLTFTTDLALAMIDVSMMDMDDVLEHHVMKVDASNTLQSEPYPNSQSGTRGESLIHNSLMKKLQSHAEIGFGDPSLTCGDWYEVVNTYLRETSDFHQDYKIVSAGSSGNKRRVLVDDLVGFVALNTNEEAYFEHSDISVPIHKGSFIKFTGSDLHRTVVNKGHVHFLGPFELRSFVKVSVAVDPPPSTAPSDVPSSHPSESLHESQNPSQTFTENVQPSQQPSLKPTDDTSGVGQGGIFSEVYLVLVIGCWMIFFLT